MTGRPHPWSAAMVWQFFVLVAASLFFPALALFMLIGPPRFPDEEK